MSDTNTRVPSVLAHELPRPVPMDELAACPASEVFRRVGDKWSMLVVILLGGRAHRYNELHRAIEGISQRMLTRTLRGLEDDGLVWRRVHPTVPPGVEYGLTELGVSLLGPLSALADWAVRHEPGMAEARRAASESRAGESRAGASRAGESRAGASEVSESRVGRGEQGRAGRR